MANNPSELQFESTDISPPIGPCLVLVNGGPESVQAPRARALFGPDSHFYFKTRGRLKSIPSAFQAIRKYNRGWIYGIDLGFPQAPLAAVRKRTARGFRLVFEIGDPMQPLLKGQGRRGAEVAVASAMDRKLPWMADALVFRGSYLYDWFRNLNPERPLPPSLWLPDGVDTTRFYYDRNSNEIALLRSKYNLNGQFVVGLVGSIHYNTAHHLFYGWEMVEALAMIPANRNITGVIVGDGPGRPILENAIAERNLTDRIRVVGRVPHEQVPHWMNLFDAALSTQTDDPVGWGRTTAKLPEYLACGTPVICSDVGEAHRFLRTSGQTLHYKGMKDASYPECLAGRLIQLSEQNLNELSENNRRIAIEQFAYPELSAKLHRFLHQVGENGLKAGDFIVNEDFRKIEQ